MDGVNRSDGKSVSTEGAAAEADGRHRRISGPGTCGIAVMAKASAPGRTKTRLVPPLTFDEAAALNTAFLKDIAENLLLAARDAAIAGYAAYAPSGSEGFFHRVLPPAIGLIDAFLSNFGDCLSRTIEEIFARGHGSAVVLNSDSPTLPTAFLVETAEVLARPGERAVLGPSSDGGYYLLGLKTAHRRLFDDIAWSTERVAGETLERAREIGLDVHMLPVWYDVDDIEGLRRLAGEVYRPHSPGRERDAHEPHHPVETALLMQRLWVDGEFTRREDFRQAESAAAGAA
ncbi:MAG: TIGR04282 family arsenosugar biosynthesis glycosyltransferase [Xanthobacteraceae bacterium]